MSKVSSASGTSGIASSSVVRGHDRPMELLARIVREGLTSGAFLLWGPEGVGKRTAAVAFCRRILCSGENGRGPCGECPSCRTPLDRHPDFRLLDRGEAASIGVDAVRALLSGTLEAPLLSPVRAAVIDEAHLLTPEGANSLLKTLEEPANTQLFFLATSAPDRLLPTLRSRLLAVRFHPLSPQDLSALAREFLPDAAPEEVAALIPLAGGSLSRLTRLLDPADREVRAQAEAFLGAFRKGGGSDVAAVASSFAALAEKDSFDRFLDGLERLLLSAERHSAGAAPDPSWRESALPARYAGEIPDFARARIHDRIGDMRRMAVHNPNRGLALEQLLWELSEAFAAGGR